jgi:hypothetical protein
LGDPRVVNEESALREITRSRDVAPDILDLVARFNRAKDGTMIVPSEYLEAVIVRA